MPVGCRRMRRVVVAIALFALAACSGDDGGDTEAFCDDVADNLDALRAEPATEGEVEELLDIWRDIGEDAPLAIEPEWRSTIEMMELLWTGDDEEEALAAVFANERAAVTIATWLDENCGIDWGPVTTIVPPAAPTTTVAGATTTTTGP